MFYLPVMIIQIIKLIFLWNTVLLQFCFYCPSRETLLAARQKPTHQSRLIQLMAQHVWTGINSAPNISRKLSSAPVFHLVHNGLIESALISLNKHVFLTVPQAAAEFCGDAASCERSLWPQTLAPCGASGLRQSWNLQFAAEWGSAGEDHQTGQTHLPT